MPDTKALLAATPESLWGLRTHGVFHPSDQKQQALDWLESACNEFGTSSLAIEVEKHVLVPSEQLRDRFRSAKPEARDLGMTMLTVVAGLRASEGLPSIRPDMSAAKADVIARTRWALYTECNGNRTLGAELGGMKESYLRVLFGRPTKPPSREWRMAFCVATGLDQVWLESGMGEGPALEAASIGPIKRMSSSVEVRPKPRFTDDEFKAELESRQERAKTREDIGLRGEQHCYEAETVRLRKAGRGDLAGQVELVSLNDSQAGYDLLTFDDAGNEIHVEIKTTIRPKESGYSFWLTQNEWRVAEKSPQWQLWRVWAIDDEPEVESLGNVVHVLPTGWNHEPASHRFYS